MMSKIIIPLQANDRTAGSEQSIILIIAFDGSFRLTTASKIIPKYQPIISGLGILQNLRTLRSTTLDQNCTHETHDEMQRVGGPLSRQILRPVSRIVSGDTDGTSGESIQCQPRCS
jgi:hypothetical protein